MTRRRDSLRSGPPVTDDDLALFRKAVQDVAPLPAPPRVEHPPARPAPVPHQSRRDEQEALADTLSDRPDLETSLEAEGEFSFLRPGLSRQILRKLKRGHWVIQDQLDLHGLTRDAARALTAEFLKSCGRRGLRCVRIIHGKGLGSKNREPVLKAKVRHWLVQRDEVLAFCPARPADGGSGAVVVLLKA